MKTQIKLPGSGDIYSELKDAILRLELEPGRKISENEISALYNVSRTPVKSAFLRLMSEGFIEISPQRGTYVTLLDLDRIRETVYMRTVLETEIVRVASPLITPDIRAELEQNLEYQHTLVNTADIDPAEFYRLDTGFHSVLFHVAGHHGLWDIIQEFHVHYTRFRMLDIRSPNRFRALYSEHERLYRTISDRRDAATLLSEHLHGNLNRLAARIDTDFSRYFTVGQQISPGTHKTCPGGVG